MFKRVIFQRAIQRLHTFLVQRLNETPPDDNAQHRLDQPYLGALADTLPTTLIRVKPTDWKWIDRTKGKYQFGSVPFQQTGGIRGKVFVAFMDEFEQKAGFISLNDIDEKVNLGHARIRIEIREINKRLEKIVGYSFVPSGKGHYGLMPQSYDN